MELTTLGFHVIAVGLDREPGLSDSIEFMSQDVTDKSTIKSVIGDYPDLAVLVNAAGMLCHEREWESEYFESVLDVNLTAVLNWSREALPALSDNQGCVVNVASMWNYFGAAGAPAYGASKGGIVSLTRSMAVAWAEQGVRVNAVAPGWIDTRLASKAIHNPERSKKIFARIPMQRWGKPEDVANVIGFLTSDKAAYITGAILPVDGGYSVA